MAKRVAALQKKKTASQTSSMSTRDQQYECKGASDMDASDYQTYFCFDTLFHVIQSSKQTRTASTSKLSTEDYTPICYDRQKAMNIDRPRTAALHKSNMGIAAVGGEGDI